MLKKNWEMPVTVVQKFEPNEYVAACWGVACDVSWANWYEQYNGYWDGGNVSHASDHCGNSSNQVIFDYDDNGVGDAMIETRTDGLGNLECTIYKDAFETEIQPDDVKIGQLIYWTTSSGNRTWHHRGTVTATAEGHPNRS